MFAIYVLKKSKEKLVNELNFQRIYICKLLLNIYTYIRHQHRRESRSEYNSLKALLVLLNEKKVDSTIPIIVLFSTNQRNEQLSQL